jgi:hypothetical protein
VAAGYPLDREPRTARGAVLFNGLDGIRGATRKITTRSGQQLTETDLIASYGEYEDRAHLFLRLPAFGGRANDRGNDRVELLAESDCRSSIRGRLGSNNDVRRPDRRLIQRRQQSEANALTKLPLETIPANCRLPVLWND